MLKKSAAIIIYVQIKVNNCQKLMLNEDDIEALQPLVKRLKDHNSVRAELQVGTACLASVYIIFQGISKNVLQMKMRLKQNQQLIENYNLKLEIVAVQSEKGFFEAR